MAKGTRTFRKLRQRGNRPLLTVAQVLAWADAYQQATGRWPAKRSGAIAGAPFGETWRSIDSALIYGFRGLPAGLSIARLLQQERGLEPRSSEKTLRDWSENLHRLLDERQGGRATLSVENILRWADDYHALNGRWPNFRAGPIEGAPGETWSTINSALIQNRRGLPGPTTLARLLVKYRGRQALNGPPELSPEEILRWADDYHAQHGHWPIESSGPVEGHEPETWKGLSMALLNGNRGLPGGSSLARLLAEHRGVRNKQALPRLGVDQILAWAEAEHAATGQWPVQTSAAVLAAPDEDWQAIDGALRNGLRGLPKGSSLSRLLDERWPERRRILSLEQIRAWAEDYRAAQGRWPSMGSGPVEGVPGENWGAIDAALRCGGRGLPGGTTLSQLFGRSKNLCTRRCRPLLSLDQVLAWADEHYAATGQWPTVHSGAIPNAPGERWININMALRHGRRGLPSGRTLAQWMANRQPPVTMTAAEGRHLRPAS